MWHYRRMNSAGRNGHRRNEFLKRCFSAVIGHCSTSGWPYTQSHTWPESEFSLISNAGYTSTLAELGSDAMVGDGLLQAHFTGTLRFSSSKKFSKKVTCVIGFSSAVPSL